MCEFESSQDSQAVRLSGKPSLVIAEMPANGGLLRICRRSPRSGISHFWPLTADSLRPIFEIFPFLGDRDRRPGSICTAWSLWQSSSGTSQLISHKIGVTQNHCGTAGRQGGHQTEDIVRSSVFGSSTQGRRRPAALLVLIQGPLPAISPGRSVIQPLTLRQK
jgi:hypothetical protein